MASDGPVSPSHLRLSRQGFKQLPDMPYENMGGAVEIPLQSVVSHAPHMSGNGDSKNMEDSEKGAMFHKGIGGRRRLKLQSASGATGGKGQDGEEDTINKMGRLYNKILNCSVLVRYFIYVLPLALIILIPIIVGATAARDAEIGGVRIVWLFTWIEIVWLSLWVSKTITLFLPAIFQFFAGVVSAGIRKYSLVIKALEIPLSLFGWALVSLTTFKPMMLMNPDQRAAGITSLQPWQKTLRLILSASLCSACIFLIEKFLIQLLSINYHRKQFNFKIRESKRNVFLLSLLYDASRALFPAYCDEFTDEDYVINDNLNISNVQSGSATPLRLVQDVGRFGDKITNVFGNVASEIAGKKVFNPNSAYSIVVGALEKKKSSEALAKRLWMSFVVEGKNELYQEDIVEVLGPGREAEAEECFKAIDRDGNGDISLDEMIFTVCEFSHKRKSIATSMHDVDQAIHVLDGLLGTIVFVVCVFIFIAFLNESFVNALATAGTALLSMSLVFALTGQEILGSCVFLFVKHPFDVGDRVDIKTDQLVVENISLLYSVFRRVTTGKIVQIPNILLNGQWIENVSRSNTMCEQIDLFIDFGTSLDDIKALKNELQLFVLDKENSRDFKPEIEVEITGVAEMNKLELRALVYHKSNWANETVRAARRSKFMCALVLALRKIPINGPGGADAPLGDSGKPSYSVSISSEEAGARREKFLADMQAKRLFPKKDDKNSDNDTNAAEMDTKANDLSGATESNLGDNKRSSYLSSNNLDYSQSQLKRRSTGRRKQNGLRSSMLGEQSGIQSQTYIPQQRRSQESLASDSDDQHVRIQQPPDERTPLESVPQYSPPQTSHVSQQGWHVQQNQQQAYNSQFRTRPSQQHR